MYLALINNLIELALMRSIEIPMDLTVLGKDILLNFFHEFFLLYKVVLPSMNFALSGPSRRIADTKFEHLRIFLN